MAKPANTDADPVSRRLPEGETLESLREYLAVATRCGDSRVEKEMERYLDGDLGRFIATLNLVPEGSGRLLEIGASPYFTTLLLERFRDYELTLTNGHGEPGIRNECVIGQGTAQQRTLSYDFFDIENGEVPFDDESFDVVLFGEVLEHLTLDPLAAMNKINRLLKPGGILVLTTPNAVRLDNAMRIFVGGNTYDQYSAYGPYGRHNREYVLSEVEDLLARSGFRVLDSYTLDWRVTPTGEHLGRSWKHRVFETVVALVRKRRNDHGFTLFAQASKAGPPSSGRPSWLYRSFPENEYGD